MIKRKKSEGSHTPITNAQSLLGEFRVDPETKEARIIPAIEIITQTGVITIPTNQIVKFKTKAKQ